METNPIPYACHASVLPLHTATAPTPRTAPRTARRDILVEEALAWLSFVRARATPSGPHALSEEAITRKAFEAMRFTLSAEAEHFAVPSKLVGTRARQAEVRALVQEKLPYGARLDVIPRGEALTVWYKRLCLGAVQAKHVPWLRPLLARGATVRLTQITGQDERRKTLGVNICFAFVGIAALRAEAALDRVAHADAAGACGDGMTGDGASGDGAAGDGATGDGMAGDGAACPVTVRPHAHPATHHLDVVLYRDADGCAHATVPHACLHSPTGIEWGYRGSGPSDLALSVLCRFTDVARAEALYRAFRDEVIARVPREGGRLGAADIARWITRQAR